MLTIQRLSGDELTHYIPDLADLRIQVFHDYPYLYDGDLDYEKRYLQTYIEAPDSVIVLAFDDDKVVGASTGIPLKYETDEVKKPFIDAGYEVDSVFYCGESVLIADYRGQGAGVAFFDHREAHAQDIGGFDYSCFCGVQRPDEHPLRPKNYQTLERFWQKRGYKKHPELQTTFSWKEIGEPQATAKPMMFWMKALT